LLLFVGYATAQNPRDPVKEYEDFRKQAEQKYTDFRNSANAQYAEFMRKAWQQYQAMAEIPAPKIPDPPKPPVIVPEEEKDKIPENKPIPYDEVIPAPVVIKQPEPVSPIPEVEIPKPQESRFSFTVFGTECKVRLTDEQRFTLKDCNENTIADTWQRLSQQQYNNLLHDCLALRVSLNLCDWAYLQLLQQLSDKFFGKNTNEATLLTAFLYNQSGYKMRLARANNRLYMLVASHHTIYNVGFYQTKDGNFYPLDKVNGSLYFCDVAFPNEQPLSLVIGKEQNFSMKATSTRTLTSERYPQVTVTVTSNQNLIDFFDTYPSSHINNDIGTRWAFYANTPLSQSVKEVLYPVLKEAVRGKSEQDAANILINFVQTAFEYGYDDDIWGEDRPFFADETIHYPFSDCEDRAILFSRLVRDIMGLKVVLLYYPGHIATAVRFNETISGDYLTVNNIRYLVCDPTYIGANIGMTMPTMDNNKAKVIFLD
jgi:hypothetical protein